MTLLLAQPLGGSLRVSWKQPVLWVLRVTVGSLKSPWKTQKGKENENKSVLGTFSPHLSGGETEVLRG